MNVAGRVLLVEDEPGLVRTLTDRLHREGYAVDSAGNGDSAIAIGSTSHFDLILLDIMLPRASGFDVCRDLRDRGITTPILMLTAKGQIADKVLGLKLGADDYLAKPFEMVELLARIEALLRRTRGTAPPTRPRGTFAFGDVVVDFEKTTVARQGRVIPLPAREFKLLRYLIERRGQTLSRDQLLDAVWGYDTDVVTRTVDVHIAALRRKLEPNSRLPEFIQTIHGFGYRFIDDEGGSRDPTSRSSFAFEKSD